MLLLRFIWIKQQWIVGIFLLMMVFHVFLISLIPVTYTASSVVEIRPYAFNIDSQQDVLKDLSISKDIIEKQKSYFSNDLFFEPIINTLKLTTRAEFLPELEEKQSVFTQWWHKKYPIKDIDLPKITRVKNNILENLKIHIDEKKAEIEFTSPSPYIARAIANYAAENYVKVQDKFADKSITKIADLPLFPSNPDYIKLTIFSIFNSVLLSIISAIALIYFQKSDLSL